MNKKPIKCDCQVRIRTRRVPYTLREHLMRLPIVIFRNQINIRQKIQKKTTNGGTNTSNCIGAP